MHYLYKQRIDPGETFLVTREQLREIIQDRHGMVLNNKSFEKLKLKYISREDKPAKRFELAIQIVTGERGVPSIWQPTGLTNLIL